jgi:hypothetical protein
MCSRMFRGSEDTLVLFDKFRSISSEDVLRTNETLEGHGSKVLEVIDDIIANFENYDDVIHTLTVTGKMHKNFRGFSPSMFWVSYY